MLPWFKSSGPDALARTALSSQPSLEQAIDEVAGSLKGMGQASLALVFCSSSFASDLPRLLPLLQQTCCVSLKSLKKKMLNLQTIKKGMLFS